MKPHLMHIAQTFARKQAAAESADEQRCYQSYMRKVERAQEFGYREEMIIKELEDERTRIMRDKREGDAIFQDGVRNSKQSCLNAINLIISELKGSQTQGEKDVFIHD